jgi:hypothetical protein
MSDPSPNDGYKSTIKPFTCAFCNGRIYCTEVDGSKRCASCGNFDYAVSNVDHVDHPAHYGGDTTYEVIKVLEAWKLDSFCLGNTIKYIARAGKKSGADELEDLKKARWYLDREIARRSTT